MSKELNRAIERWRLVAALCAGVFVIGLFCGPSTSFWSSRPGTVVQDLAARAGLSTATRGFHAHIESQPSGATVVVGGKVRGETPFFGNVPCKNDEPVLIEIRSKGFRPWVRNPLCREGESLKVNARLEKEAGPTP